MNFQLHLLEFDKSMKSNKLPGGTKSNLQADWNASPVCCVTLSNHSILDWVSETWRKDGYPFSYQIEQIDQETID
ncbi:Uncharacterized protein TCM_041828 [Theobroma cacao]|uniref:Uncharacterized protein n=1 Tax=Theobroma cacao TaxID=3641 RepID=A0A061GX08_THECC|nr:Uncharacterized protein TCM_041828 [Theobroma cacao]